jgi:VWFA-related protein
MIRMLRHSLASLGLLAALSAGPAVADVSVRVEGRPQSEPVEVFVRVTDDVSGVPITDLEFTDFDVSIDGVAEVLTGDQFTQPQEADPNQHVSVVFVMDYTSSVTNQFLAEMQTAVIDFIEAMEPGDMAAIIKFNDTSGEQVVQAFTEIDDGTNDQLLIGAVASSFDGDGSNILDAVNLGVLQFVGAGATLPDGPKAVILVSDGRDSHSSANQGNVIDAANEISIPLFTIGIGNPQTRGLTILTHLADDTGGQYVDATDGGDIGAAYESVRLLLTGEYLITIPNSITDCEAHEATVAVDGHAGTVTVPFTRRTCITRPSDFDFDDETNVAPGAVVTSNTATIEGIEAPAHISVIQGSYSIGCDGTFTSDPGTIEDGEEVCVQQTASNQASTSKTTTLTVGGLAVTFTTTTRESSGGGGGGGGGGGTTGLVELLLGLALLLGRRRLAA